MIYMPEETNEDRINQLEKEIEELKDELFEAYRMQLKGMVVGGQLDWVRNRMRELED
jgi:ribosomal protein L29